MVTMAWDDALEDKIAETLMRRYEAAYGRPITNPERDAYKAFEKSTARLVLTVLAECGLIERKQTDGANHGHG